MLGRSVQSGKRQAPAYTLSGRDQAGSFHVDLQKASRHCQTAMIVLNLILLHVLKSIDENNMSPCYHHIKISLIVCAASFRLIQLTVPRHMH